jgi:DNA (cytosine-5)-methyltransferase 1
MSPNPNKEGWVCMKDFIRPVAVDLFAGAGGMTLGFEQAGFDVPIAVEVDPVHCATHHYNFPFWSILCRSVENLSAKEIREAANLGLSEIDVVFGGPPCQGFSVIGKRVLEDPRNHLVFHFLRLVVDLQPKYFVMENVAGLNAGQYQPLMLEIIAAFRQGGYEVVTPYQVLNAAHYGIPQNRHRLFLLGCRQGWPLPAYPQPFSQATPTVWEAIGDLPEVNDYPELFSQDWIVAEYGKPSNYAGQLRGLFPVEDDYSYPRHFDRGRLTSSLATQHSAKSIARFASTVPGQREPVSRFYKLSPQGLCNTLRAGTASNRGAFTAPRPIHPVTPRCITVREAARLHSYPDWFRFHTTKWHGFRQVGNSVPPLLVKAVAAQIMQGLGRVPVKPAQMYALGDEQLLQLKMSQAADYYRVDSHVIAPRSRKSCRC